MKPFLLFVALVFQGVILVSQSQPIKIFHEIKTQGYIIYANNSELYPISISLDLDVLNLGFSEGERKIFVVPAKNEKFKIGELSVVKPNAQYKFSYKYISAMGDVTVANYDKAIEYDLPFQTGKTYKVYQGYNGSFSHQGENAIDFTMPEGTEIVAARDGMIVQLVQNNTESCPRKECEKYNNYMTVMHSDGSFSNYAHIKYNGSKLKIGETVKRGQVIAYSGNVGYSSGPHLHFVCFLGAFGKWNTLPTLFKIGKGDEAILLKEKMEYLRAY